MNIKFCCTNKSSFWNKSFISWWRFPKIKSWIEAWNFCSWISELSWTKSTSSLVLNAVNKSHRQKAAYQQQLRWQTQYASLNHFDQKHSTPNYCLVSLLTSPLKKKWLQLESFIHTNVLITIALKWQIMLNYI